MILPGPPPKSADSADDIIWQKTLRISILVLLIAMLLAVPASDPFSQYFFMHQDMPVLLAIVTLMAAMLLFPFRSATIAKYAIKEPFSLEVFAPIVAIFLILLTWAGHYVVMSDYPFSRDEQMVFFDAAIFSKGEWFARLPPAWLPLSAAINDNFVQPLAPGVLISNYRPINALLHAAMIHVGAIAFTAPALSALGLVATWRIAARIWPQSREAQLVTVILYATSAQVWATAMTGYAMTGHLALNMLWLWLFLRAGRLDHVGAAAIGFLATGLHQLPYHPLFVGPFLVMLMIDRRWRLFAFYAVSYAATLFFWIAYFKILSKMAGIDQAFNARAPAYLSADPATYMVSNVIGRLDLMTDQYIWVTFANLCRFFAWENLLLLPLLLAGAVLAVRGRDRLMIALIVALAAPVVMKLILFPSQGHGWGYRYEHGLIGAACLVGAYGWIGLRRVGAVQWGHLGIASAITLCLAMPFLLWQAHIMLTAYKLTSLSIGAVDTDVVIVDANRMISEEDLVNNPPDLSRRPVRLLARAIDRSNIPIICSKGTIAFVTGDQLWQTRRLFQVPAATSERTVKLQELFRITCPDRIRTNGLG